MRFKNILLATASVLLVDVAFIGCDAASDDTGRIIVRMTDAPIEYVSEINVTVVSCQIINSTTDERETISSTAAATMFNLLTLTDGGLLDVCDQEVTLTTFDQLRVVIGDEATITFGTDALAVTDTLHVASGSSSGLKFFFDAPVDVSGGGRLDVLLDFVADESVVSTGPPLAPTGYVMTPVIKAVSATLNEVELVISDDGEVAVQ